MASQSHRSSFPISLRMALIIPYVALIILTAGVSGYISFRNGQRAVNDVAQQMRNELAKRVESHLSGLLKSPRQINSFNENLILQGIIDPSDFLTLQGNFLEEVKSYPNITSVYFGNMDGGIIGSGREGADGTLYVYSTEKYQAGTFSKFAISSGGFPTNLLSSVPNFDARTRPWFQGATNNAKETWSDIYILFTGQDLAIANSRPVYDPSGKLQGVLSVDLFLSQVSQDLQAMDIPQGGTIFIVDRSGFLVATSSGEKLFTETATPGKLQRVSAQESNNPTIQQAAQLLQNSYGNDLSKLTTAQSLEFNLSGKRQFVQALPYSDNGLYWTIAVVLPEAIFMERITANGRWAITVTALAILFAVLVSIFFANQVTERISKLNRVAQALARGEWSKELHAESQIIELKELEASFHQMHDQIRNTLRQLTDEIHDRKVSEAKFRSVVEQSQEGFNLVDENGLVVEWNQGMERLSGILSDEAVGRPIWEVQYRMMPDNMRTDALLGMLESQTRDALKTRQGDWLNTIGTGEIQHTSGARRFILTNIYTVLFEEKFMIGGAMHDITAEKQALQEKETLLRELYHRTKNNMQVISSLLSLQKDYTSNPEVLLLVQEMKNRIDSMAMVHEKLYQSRNLSSIDLAEYIRSLGDLLKKSYNVNSFVELCYELESAPVSIDIAIPCGLILNELVSNALKYAFPNNRQGKIVISLQHGADQKITMVVADNGVGLPNEFELHRDGKLGLETIFALGEMQLQGAVEFQTTTGVTCVVTFSDSPYSPRI